MADGRIFYGQWQNEIFGRWKKFFGQWQKIVLADDKNFSLPMTKSFFDQWEKNFLAEHKMFFWLVTKNFLADDNKKSGITVWFRKTGK